MALVPSELANLLYESLGHTQDKDGVSQTTELMQQYAAGYCACLQAGIVNNPPDTVNGTSPSSGGAITNGEASDGVMVLSPSVMSAITLAAFPSGSSALLQEENTAVITYVMTGSVSFASGSITGTSTCTPVNPGALTAGKGSNGLIGSLDGNACASFVQAQVPELNGPDMQPFYTTLMNYTMSHAVVTYATGTVQGSFSAGGGAMIGGSGAGGTIA
jgi:hypothetical protein